MARPKPVDDLAQLSVRLPRPLLAELTAAAEERDLSLNKAAVIAIRRGLPSLAPVPDVEPAR